MTIRFDNISDALIAWAHYGDKYRIVQSGYDYIIQKKLGFFEDPSFGYFQEGRVLKPEDIWHRSIQIEDNAKEAYVKFSQSVIKKYGWQKWFDKTHPKIDEYSLDRQLLVLDDNRTAIVKIDSQSNPDLKEDDEVYYTQEAWKAEQSKAEKPIETVEQLNAIVKDLANRKEIRWSVRSDGCEARAKLTQRYLRLMGIPKKDIELQWVSIPDHLRKLKYPWQFHVAVIVKVKGVKWIIDPSLCAEKALTLEEWIGFQHVDNRPINIGKTNFEPNKVTAFSSAYDNFYRIRPNEKLAIPIFSYPVSAALDTLQQWHLLETTVFNIPDIEKFNSALKAKIRFVLGRFGIPMFCNMISEIVPIISMKEGGCFRNINPIIL